MSTPACAHLHVHSEYSLLDGACKIEALAARAAELGQPAIGLTDHGVMNGAVELYQAARKHGIKPILGCEIYFVDDRRDTSTRKEVNHLTLLAASDEGFRNLVKLSSTGFLEGLYRGRGTPRPTVDMELLDRHAGGVIALTGCLASRFAGRLAEGRDAEARAHADELLGVFGHDNVYFEVQKNGLAQQDRANEGIVRIAREVGRPLVAAGDVHYLRREDYHHHTALLCVQTKSTLADPKMTFETNEFFLKSNEEMAQSFAEWPEALASTVEIAERCETTIPLGQNLIPRYPTPGGEEESAYLRVLVEEGLRRRYGAPPPAEAVERMNFELGVIESMGFSGYFLIVWDFVKWAHDNGIAVGPGRGSAAGSLVAYCLQITDVDPLRYDLLFERFLNPERVSMPDIDIDFSVRGRERVMRYVTDKYGSDRVAQIVTFGKMFPRAATRDAARVLGHDYAVGDRLAKLIPEPQQGRAPSFEDCLAPGSELRAAYDADPTAKQVVDVAKGLEGIVRNSSIHAAAVVIADRPLTDIVPVQLAEVAGATDENGNKVYKTVTQFSMKPVEEIGLLKMDFLGLRNLDVIEGALDIIERSSGARPDIGRLPLDDPATYEMLARGDSIGVFQFESEGMREALKKVKPTEFDDLVALVALYRPGAMDQIPAYARGKRDPESVTIPDERLAPIIGPTYGVILYQEQAMQIAKSLAGFSGAKADDLRKAIGKKNREAMAKLKPEFMTGCQASGVAPVVTEWIWSTNEKSADYSFNRSHAACYALIAYRTAWLKANHPAEYMAALISSVMSTKDKVPFFVAQTEQMGIEILPPDVNLSDHDFVVVEGNIRFGLDAVKGMGWQAVEAIKAAREEDGPFTSLWDFCARVDCRAVNKKAIEALVHCGAFDSTGDSRKGMISILEQAQGAGAQSQQDAQIGQGSIFDLAGDSPAGGAAAAFAPSYPPIPAEEFEQGELLAREKEAIGIFISAHPLKQVREALLERVDVPLAELDTCKDNDWVLVGGIVTSFRRINTRAGATMAVVVLDDLSATVEVLVFEKALAELGEVLAVDEVVLIKGRVDHKDKDRSCVKLQNAEPFRPSDAEVEKAREAAALRRTGPEPFNLLVRAGALPAAVIDELKHVFANFPGESDVVLNIQTEERVHTLRLGPGFKVAPTPSLRAELASILGASALTVPEAAERAPQDEADPSDEDEEAAPGAAGEPAEPAAVAAQAEPAAA